MELMIISGEHSINAGLEGEDDFAMRFASFIFCL
jgi:hypothetical protein